MSEIDEQFIEYIIKSLVNKPDEVKIQRSVDERGVLLELSVDPEDLGRVIGKRGATAQSLRTLLRALGTKNEARYNLKIVDTDGGEGRSAPPTDTPAPAIDDNQPTDDVTQSEPAQEESATTDEVVAEELPSVEEQASTTESEDDDQTDLASKTRRELAELDDLDL